MTQIQEWMQSKSREDKGRLHVFCEALKNADGETVTALFREYMEETVSIRDTAVRKDMKENFYHGFLLGLLRANEDWLVLSNRESGKGYADIVVEIYSEKTGIVIEMKYAEDGNLAAGCREAMMQIDRSDYTDQPRQNGIKQKYLRVSIRNSIIGVTFAELTKS